MSNRNTVSVIIPVYNQAKAVSRCLRSIFGQTYKDLEVIVVDDGSTDKLAVFLRSWSSQIKLLKTYLPADSQKNKGAPRARNLGFEHSHGKYVIFCDADIVMNPDMIAKMAAVLDNDQAVSFVYSSFKFGWKKFQLFPFDIERLKKMPYIPTTSMIRREHFPGFDESLKKFQDWDLWLTMVNCGHQGLWLNQVLFQAKTGGTMSTWFPKIFFKIPALSFGRIKSEIKKFNEAKDVIIKKHGL